MLTAKTLPLAPATTVRAVRSMTRVAVTLPMVPPARSAERGVSARQALRCSRLDDVACIEPHPDIPHLRNWAAPNLQRR